MALPRKDFHTSPSHFVTTCYYWVTTLAVSVPTLPGPLSLEFLQYLVEPVLFHVADFRYIIHSRTPPMFI